MGSSLGGRVSVTTAAGRSEERTVAHANTDALDLVHEVEHELFVDAFLDEEPSARDACLA